MEGMHEGWNGSTPRLLIGGRGVSRSTQGVALVANFPLHVPS